MLYEYAVIENVYDEDGDYKCERIVVPVTPATAESEEIARALAARAIPDDVDMNEVEILVRPFV